MMNNESQAATSTRLLNPVSAANTAAATSAWVDVRDCRGSIMVVVQNGAVTGSITWTLEHATDNSGTSGAAITPNEGAFTASAANIIIKRTINARACQGFIRVVGTIVTGPALVAASCHARPQSV